MAGVTRGLGPILMAIRRFHGGAPGAVSRDPFRLILHEQVGYLVADDRRLAAYRRLEKEVGLAPADILAASPRTLEAIARAGGAIGARLRAGRMRRSAEIVTRKWQGRLDRALRLPLPQARAALAAFPMIGRPGADRILAITGAHAVLGLDSNALRVLLRLGWGEDRSGYAATYRCVQEAVAGKIPPTPRRLADVSAVLRRHGQEICRRSAPRCAVCPVARDCAFARATRDQG